MTSIKKKENRRCLVCNKIFKSKNALVEHLENKHRDMIPEDWSARRYECYLRTGKVEGHCIYCGEPTGFNEATGKYYRLCKKQECRKRCSDEADKNMIGVHGKTTLFNDPDFQRKVVYAKKNSGTYIFEDMDDPNIHYEAMYDSSYGRDFLEMCDAFLYMNGQDILGPSPHTYYYEYEGKTHFYIPDFYILSLGLEIEIKDGGSNPNKHPEVVRVAKVKEKLKDDLMASLQSSGIRYIKICNKDYKEFFALLSELKAQDIVYLPRWAEPNSKVVPVSEDAREVVGTVPRLDDDVLDSLPKNLGRINRSRIDLSKTTYLDQNITSYDGAIQTLKDGLKHCDNPVTVMDYRQRVDKFYNYLGKVANNREVENESLQREAIRARKTIDMEIYPSLNSKELKIEREQQRKRKQQRSVLESAIANPQNSTPLFIGSENVHQFTGGRKIRDHELDNIRIPIWTVLLDTKTLGSKIIRSVTGDPYNHAAISLTPHMRQMFSFTMESENGGGFVIEDIRAGWYKAHENEIRYSIYSYLATLEEFFTANEVIQKFYKEKEKYHYNVIGLIMFYSKHKWLDDDSRICSEFCTEILQAMNPAIATKRRDAYNPYSLHSLKRMFHCQRGVLKNFNYVKLVENTKKKANERGYEIWIPSLKTMQGT